MTRTWRSRLNPRRCALSDWNAETRPTCDSPRRQPEEAVNRWVAAVSRVAPVCAIGAWRRRGTCEAMPQASRVACSPTWPQIGPGLAIGARHRCGPFGAMPQASRFARWPAWPQIGPGLAIGARHRRGPFGAMPQASRFASWSTRPAWAQASRSVPGTGAGRSGRCRRRAESRAGRPGRHGPTPRDRWPGTGAGRSGRSRGRADPWLVKRTAARAGMHPARPRDQIAGRRNPADVAIRRRRPCRRGSPGRRKAHRR